MLQFDAHALRGNIAAAACPDVDLVAGVPELVNTLAADTCVSHRFLRAGWFGRSTPDALSTLVARRDNGKAILALPLRPVGPPVLGARSLAGSYWPFRSAPLAQDADLVDIIAVLDDPVTSAAVGPVLRLGPIYDSDPLALLLTEAAKIKGWSVLNRSLGTTYIQELGDPSAPDASGSGSEPLGWPSKSRRRKIRRMQARLEGQGPVTVRIVRGLAWSRQVFRDLRIIEANSWVGSKTDHSGAKFLNPAMMAHWQRAVVDPVIADMLSAAILYVGDRPVAFSLDLQTGPLQYGIASSYDEAFSPYSPGQIVTVHAIAESIARGVRQIDWGAGDSGYKQEIGAKPGAAIQDFLIVRSPALANTLRPRWEGAGGTGTMALLTGLGVAAAAALLAS